MVRQEIGQTGGNSSVEWAFVDRSNSHEKGSGKAEQEDPRLLLMGSRTSSSAALARSAASGRENASEG